VDAGKERLYFVLMESDQKVGIEGRRRVPSDSLIFDAQFWLRCLHCNRRSQFRDRHLRRSDAWWLSRGVRGVRSDARDAAIKAKRPSLEQLVRVHMDADKLLYHFRIDQLFRL